MEFDPQILRHCWFLAGPTASGKTSASLELAKLLGAEIITLDSMSLYRGLDIGTAKPNLAERARVPHHLIDSVEPHVDFSLAEYLQAAESACREILDRQRTPLFVGGTGLYLRAVLRGLFEGPPANWDLRRKWESLAESDGPEAVHRELQAVDVASAARLHPHDLRRVIRALEVFALTGTPLSAQQREQPRPLVERTPHVYWLQPPREWLYDRIDRRVEQMFAEGLVAEVAGLLAAEQPLSRTARQALGYKEVIDHLTGQQSLAETVALIQTKTRQFAKRQHTWFRNLEECVAIDLRGSETPRELAEMLSARGEALDCSER